MKIGYIQNSPIFGEKEKNFQAVSTLVENIKADLLVLPELFATGYTFTSKDEAKQLAEPTDGKTAGFLKEVSKQTEAVIVAGFVEKDNQDIYNSATMIFEDQIIGSYRKIHLFNKEKFWFSPGNKKLQCYDVKGMKVGMMICFDWLFPEVSRKLALEGVEVIAHPSNLVLPYGQQAMATRCIENRVFAITANRVGRETRGEDDFLFTGASQITAFDGQVLSSAPKDTPHVAIVEVDLDKSNDKMITDNNDVLKDRREEFYK